MFHRKKQGTAEQLRFLKFPTASDFMILSVTFSKPAKNISEILGADYVRIKIKRMSSSAAPASFAGDGSDGAYFAELYTQKQVFHRKMSEKQCAAFIEEHAGKTFKNCVERTESEEITFMANRRGDITRLVKKIPGAADALRIGASAGGSPEAERKDEPRETAKRGKPGSVGGAAAGGERPENINSPYIGLISSCSDLISGRCASGAGQNRRKKYLLSEGNPVPFLVLLGIMTSEGKVIASKHDKFRQINRFLEFVDDILPEILRQKREAGEDEKVSVVDFGSGKSYLTFAVQYFLTEIRKVPCEVFGLDLKKDVIDYCSSLAEKLGLRNLSFAVGDIASFGEEKRPDLIVTLHACDTATDFALDYAVRHGAKAILSVPCCQHEINAQVSKSSVAEDSALLPLVKYGLIKERFCALVTDAVRGEILENNDYRVQMLEFIDAEGTPKNLLIRAVKNPRARKDLKDSDCGNRGNRAGEKLLREIGAKQKLLSLLESFGR